ncbi:hypothetical protein ACR3K2_27970 [Cryptosporidium serpentis]
MPKRYVKSKYDNLDCFIIKKKNKIENESISNFPICPLCEDKGKFDYTISDCFGNQVEEITQVECPYCNKERFHEKNYLYKDIEKSNITTVARLVKQWGISLGDAIEASIISPTSEISAINYANQIKNERYNNFLINQAHEQSLESKLCLEKQKSITLELKKNDFIKNGNLNVLLDLLLLGESEFIKIKTIHSFKIWLDDNILNRKLFINFLNLRKLSIKWYEISAKSYFDYRINQIFNYFEYQEYNSKPNFLDNYEINKYKSETFTEWFIAENNVIEEQIYGIPKYSGSIPEIFRNNNNHDLNQKGILYSEFNQSNSDIEEIK